MRYTESIQEDFLSRRWFALALGMGLCLAPLWGAEVPRPAPELVIRQVNGPQLLLSQFRGKVVAIEFLHTTCPHCQNCSSLLNRMYKEYGPRGFQPVGIAFNDMATLLVPDFIKQLGLSFPVGVSTREEVMSYLQFPLVERMFVPQLIFVDRKGTIRAQYSGEHDFFKPESEEANMRAQIESLLTEPAATQKARPRARGKQGAKPARVSSSRALK